MDPVFIGIDPGMSGGLACLVGQSVRAVRMPETERDILDCLRDFATSSDGDCCAILENVGSSPQMGVVSAFKFGGSYFGLRMALVASLVPFDEVSPQRWQKMLGCKSGGDKNVTKQRAQELFPTTTVTHAVADALLLAEYCRRVKLGQLASDVQPATLKPKKTRFNKKTNVGLF